VPEAKRSASSQEPNPSGAAMECVSLPTDLTFQPSKVYLGIG
jgi:hypothetical protein